MCARAYFAANCCLSSAILFWSRSCLMRYRGTSRWGSKRVKGTGSAGSQCFYAIESMYLSLWPIAISQNTSSTTFPFPFRGYGHTHFWPSLFINQFKQIGCIRKFQISSSCLFQLCECPFKTPCNEPQLSPCRRHISLCIFSGVELKLFHWECLFLVSYGNIKRKPGFFTSTESGRGITGTALRNYE